MDHTNTNADKLTLPKVNPLPKEQKHTELKTEKWDAEVPSKKRIEITITEEEETNAQEEEILIPKEPETERERAKRMLMQQMKN